MFDELIGAYPFMYVDDLCVLISSRFTPNLKHILDAMHQFSKVSGLRLNLGKSELVLEGDFFQQELDYFEGCGLSIQPYVKYSGVQIGNLSASQAFSKVMGEAHKRSALVASFGLSLAERLLLLKTWDLPVLLLTAKAYRATEQEERSLKVVFNTALGFDSWGTTLSQASLHPDDGGFSLPPPPPDTWLKVQAGLAFTAFAQNQSIMPCFVRLKFRAWATKFGVPWHMRSLPFLQLGPIPYSTMGFLAQSL